MVHFLELQLLLMTSAPADGLGATKETPLRGAIRNSLAEWTKCALGPLNQEPTAHHKLLIRELEDISTGANTRLIVLMPPGSAKSTYASEYVDTRLFRSGDTMTGPLILSADPAAALGATTKEYTDGQFARSLPVAGGTMTGPLTLAANPTTTLQAAPKQYVDGQVATSLPLTGGILSGALGLPTYTVTHLPPATVGALAYATDGRKPSETAGGGTGVLVVGGGGGQWESVMSGTAVLS